MGYKNITIAMAIGRDNDKIGYLSNVLFSLKNQHELHEYNIRICIFNDGENEEKVWKVIDTFFDRGQVIYKMATHPQQGFQFLVPQLGKLIPPDSDIVVFQSCDTIWYDRDILTTMVQELEREKCVVSTATVNFHIDKTLFQRCAADVDKFKRELQNTISNPRLRSKPKPSRFGYLCAMRKDTFLGLAAHPFMCDVTQHNFYKKENIPFKEMKNVSIHQAHPSIIYACGSLLDCDTYCIRRGPRNGWQYRLEMARKERDKKLANHQET